MMRLPLLSHKFAILLLPLACVFVAPAWGQAYIPKADAQVLERLPFKPADPVARELSAMRTELRKNPQDRALAVRLANRYYEMVAEDGDPRFLGYAEAALGPWWQLAAPPDDVRLIRARLRQFLHDFPGATGDLDAILKNDPANDGARVLRAIIRIVQAEYSAAQQDCEQMRGGPNALVGQGCESMIAGLTGKAAAGDAALQAALAAAPATGRELRMWVNIRLAELAQRRGDSVLAEKRFRAALAQGVTDTFLEAAYADLLLDLGRPAEVVAMLKDKVKSDGLLLRLVFAEHQLKLPSAAEHSAALAARYAAAQLRGDTVHQQEEARFTLAVQGNAAKALWLAQENWRVQREPRDARIFLEAATAAKDAKAAAPVLQWLADSGIEDPLLRKLGAGLQGGAK